MSQHKNEYDEYLSRKHANLVTPQDIIDSVIKKATGQKIISQKRLMLGEKNEVYDIKLQDKNVILRIAHAEYDAFGKEKWALTRCKESGVSVPEVLFVEDFEIDGKFRSACVLEKLSGVPLRARMEQKTISDKDLNHILHKAGEILSQIHTIIPTGFGRIDENGQGEYPTWGSYILKRAKDINEYKEKGKAVDISPRDIDTVFQILDSHQEIYRTVAPHLLHSDYGYEHIMVNGNEITGIIDFGNIKGGDPVYDFAWWQFFYGDNERTQSLKNGYTNRELFKGNFDTKLNLYLLNLSLSLLAYYFEGNFKDGMSIAKRNMKKSLNYFKG